MNCLRLVLLASGTLLSTNSLAADVKIASWNIAASPYEKVLARASDYKKMADTLSPDVIVMIELTERADLKAIADAIGWPIYYATVSDGQVQGDEIHASREDTFGSDHFPISTVWTTGPCSLVRK
ncbi:hypothetical protein [Rhizobium leguminosarum]|uniref:hypothetical protein n=1 Tax=Rhizobium leguminosarum TaxID=384 RepID=UPI003F9B28B7